METATLHVTRRPERLLSDDKRVITRYLDFKSPKRIRSILKRLMAVPEEEISPLLAQVHDSFSHRHRAIRDLWRDNYREVARYLQSARPTSEERQLLIGAFFTMEYAIESAALFNPSIVLHPDQRDVPAGSVRFLLSLRATGEGHLSSIVFRRGLIDPRGAIAFDPPPRYAYTARPAADRELDKRLLLRKLIDMGAHEPLVRRAFDLLGDRFGLDLLRKTIADVKKSPDTPPAFRTVAEDILWLAEANYQLRFPADCMPSEIIIFPATEHPHDRRPPSAGSRRDVIASA
ncbi:MAG: hypothetical protein JXQ73_00020 [Phycisphaerae bacterium]|nr:hypothetical protein [Phycisphaerae bacterium]